MKGIDSYDEILLTSWSGIMKIKEFDWSSAGRYFPVLTGQGIQCTVLYYLTSNILIQYNIEVERFNKDGSKQIFL